jgi:hypothetical protein
MISLDENFIPCLSFRRAFVCFLFSKLAYKLIISIKKNKWELKFYQARESQMKLGRFFYIFFFFMVLPIIIVQGMMWEATNLRLVYPQTDNMHAWTTTWLSIISQRYVFSSSSSSSFFFSH